MGLDKILMSLCACGCTAHSIYVHLEANQEQTGIMSHRKGNSNGRHNMESEMKFFLENAVKVIIYSHTNPKTHCVMDIQQLS